MCLYGTVPAQCEHSVLYAGLRQFELYPQGVKGPVVARFCCEVVHGLCVDALQIPHGSVGGVPRENLNSGNLDSPAAEKLDAPLL